jgi:hypothetical protein
MKYIELKVVNGYRYIKVTLYGIKPSIMQAELIRQSEQKHTSTSSFTHFNAIDSGSPSEAALSVATSGVPKASEILFGYMFS